MAQRGALCACALGTALGACDNDPSRPDAVFPTATSTVPDSTRLGRQEGIRFLFPGGVLAQSALDPANFVVTNLCTGLRVPGSLRLGGDTLVFTPSQALPFLTRLSVRIQNLQATNGAELRQPITATFVTEPPPVSDASWGFLNSPSNDAMTGIDFPGSSGRVGYLLSFSGGVYRSEDAGRSFGALFKNVDVNTAFGLDAFGPGVAVAAPGTNLSAGADSLYFVANVRTPGGFRGGLLRSVNSGISFDTVGNTVSEILLAANFVRSPGAGTVIRGVVAGAAGSPQVYSYNSTVGSLVRATIASPSNTNPTDVAIARDTVGAVLTASVATDVGTGIAFRSTDGGRTFVAVGLPGDTPSLRGTGFINNTSALLLGDSSRVVRLNVLTGTFESLGAAQGIPQTEVDELTGERTVFSFRKARFDAGGQVGYVVGESRRVRPGTPDVIGGVILRTTDGGATFVRQAISGAPNNGLAFPRVADVKVKPSGLAVLSGNDGLTAARLPNAPSQIAVCSLTQP